MVLAVGVVSAVVGVALDTGPPDRGASGELTVETDDGPRPGRAADAGGRGGTALIGAQQPSGHWARRPRSPGAWETLPSPPVTAPVARLVAAGDEPVLVAGPPVGLPSHGEDRPPHAVALDDADRWRELPDPPLARLHSAAWFDGQLVVVGRDTTNRRAMATLARTADGWADTWREAAAPSGEGAVIGVGEGDRGALIAPAPAGTDETGSARAPSHYRYRPERDQWQALSAPVRVEDDAVVQDAGGRMAVIGHTSDSNRKPLRALTVYEPRVDQWSEPTALPFQHWKPGFVADGAGGLYAVGPNPAVADEPDPASARWHPDGGWQELGWAPPSPSPGRPPQLYRDGNRLWLWPAGTSTRPATLDLATGEGWQPLPAPPVDAHARTSAWTGDGLVAVTARAEPHAVRLTLDP